MTTESAMSEINSTVLLAFSKYLKDFKIQITEIRNKSTVSWKFSFSYHCQVSGEDIAVSDGAYVDDKKRIVEWVLSSLLNSVHQKNKGGVFNREVQEIEKKGENLGFSPHSR